MTGLDKRPFFLPGGPVGCLLVHGFTATPYDMRFFAEKLHGLGYTVNAVRLAGHGTSAEDLERATWRDWYHSVEDGLAALTASTQQRVVIGQSLGALLSLRLAAERPQDVHAVVPISTALVSSQQLLDWVGPYLPWLTSVLPAAWRFLPKSGSDIADPEAKARALTLAYDRFPLRAVAELVELQQQMRSRLGEVRQPTLAVHARQDHTCPMANLELLERGLGGELRTLVVDNSYHVVSVDADRALVAAEIADFVANFAVAQNG